MDNNNWALRFGTFFLIVLIVMMLWSNGIIFPGGEDQGVPQMDIASDTELEESEQINLRGHLKERFDLNKLYERPWVQRSLDNYIQLIGNARDSQARAHLFVATMEEGIRAFWMATSIYFEPVPN